MRQRLWLATTIVGAFLSLSCGYWQLYLANLTPDMVVAEEEKDKSLKLKEVVFYIGGAVSSPGVYSLRPGSRIIDAVKASGGFSAQVDLSQVNNELNLSAEIAENQKIIIPYQETKTVIPASGNSSSQTSINSASLEQLMELSGVGEVTAQKIINGRPYSALTDLTTKKILSAKLFAQIQSDITL